MHCTRYDPVITSHGVRDKYLIQDAELSYQVLELLITERKSLMGVEITKSEAHTCTPRRLSFSTSNECVMPVQYAAQMVS